MSNRFSKREHLLIVRAIDVVTSYHKGKGIYSIYYKGKNEDDNTLGN